MKLFLPYILIKNYMKLKNKILTRLFNRNYDSNVYGFSAKSYVRKQKEIIIFLIGG